MSLCTHAFNAIYHYCCTSKLSRYASILGCLSVFNLFTAERAIFKRCSLPVLHSNTNTETSSPPAEPCETDILDSKNKIDKQTAWGMSEYLKSNIYFSKIFFFYRVRLWYLFLSPVQRPNALFVQTRNWLADLVWKIFGGISRKEGPHIHDSATYFRHEFKLILWLGTFRIMALTATHQRTLSRALVLRETITRYLIIELMLPACRSVWNLSARSSDSIFQIVFFDAITFSFLFLGGGRGRCQFTRKLLMSDIRCLVNVHRRQVWTKLVHLWWQVTLSKAAKNTS